VKLDGAEAEEREHTGDEGVRCTARQSLLDIPFLNSPGAPLECIRETPALIAARRQTHH
jgi:hypothetical protein